MSDSIKSGNKVDENIVRLIAAQVALLIIIILFTKWLFPAFLLVADFGLRAFTRQLSPLAASASIFRDLFKLKNKPVFAPPKKFAAKIGFFFTLILLYLIYLDRSTEVLIVGSLLLLFSALESVFRICVGCYTYNWLYSIKQKR